MLNAVVITVRFWLEALEWCMCSRKWLGFWGRNQSTQVVAKKKSTIVVIIPYDTNVPKLEK